MKNILVTGGAGYIGSHVVNLLGEAGHNLTIIDDLSTGREASLLYGDHHKFPLQDQNKLEEVLKSKSFDACLHFAGSIVVPESVTEPVKYYENNTVNSLRLMDACQRHGINHFIFSSTAAIYGDSPSGTCLETDAPAPMNPYGHSKLMTEQALKDLSFAQKDFKYVCLRYFNVAGANVDLKVGQCTQNATHLIKVVAECVNGKRDSVDLYGTDYGTPDGTCIRDYIHVDDLAQAHLDSLEYLFNDGESNTFNCGYGQGFSVKEIIEAAKKVSGIDFQVHEKGRRAGDSPKLIANSEKLQNIVGWKPKYNDIELIIKTALDWENKLSKL
ncbi:MAG: UDP-glucose 4-epimerase GalE [Bacteriovoracaceae bacterium]